MTSPEQVRGFFSRNSTLKASALGLSILLWTLVRLDAPGPLSIPIEIQLADDGWAVVDGPNPAKVDVRFDGPAGEVINLLRMQASMVIPIDDVSSSDTVVILRREWIPMGGTAGLTVLDLNPPSVSIRFQRLIAKELPVAVRLIGDLPESIALSAPIAVVPPQVQVRGASGLLAAHDSLVLAPFDLSRIRMTDTVEVPFETAGLVGMSLADSVVTLRFVVEPSVSVLFGDVPVEMNGMPDATDLEVSPRSVTVEVIGAESLVQAIDQSRVTVRVDVSELVDMMPGTRRNLVVEVRGVPDLVEVRVVPASVEVRRVQGW